MQPNRISLIEKRRICGSIVLLFVMYLQEHSMEPLVAPQLSTSDRRIGAARTAHILNRSSDHLFLDYTRVTRPVFWVLLNWLIIQYPFITQDDRNGKHSGITLHNNGGRALFLISTAILRTGRIQGTEKRKSNGILKTLKNLLVNTQKLVSKHHKVFYLKWIFKYYFWKHREIC